MKLGDMVKKVLAPFVKGTRLEHCAGCERRRQILNKFSDGIVRFVAKLTCPCFWLGWVFKEDQDNGAT